MPFRVGSGQPGHDGGDFSLRLLDRNSGLQSSYNREAADLALHLCRSQLQRGDEIDFRRTRGLRIRVFEQLKIGRQDTNNCRRGPVELDLLSDNARILAETPYPEPMTDQHDR